MKGSGWCSEASSDMNVKPAWLERLMAETFFATCGVHMNHKKNIFCLRCCLSICPHCTLSSHTSHPLLQVRRYVYHDVVRLGDLEKLIDCSNIQAYTINGAKVIFLKQRAQTQSSSRSCNKGTGNACCTCDRILQEPYHFCSLSCKVDHMVCEGEGLSNIIESDFTYLQFEDLRVDCYTQIVPTSCSNSEATSNIAIANNTTSNNNNNNTNAFFLSLGSRRKGAPHRAPLS